jgi:hypothetical protein
MCRFNLYDNLRLTIADKIGNFGTHDVRWGSLIAEFLRVID